MASKAQLASRARFGALARVMQRMSRWQRTPAILANLRNMTEKAKPSLVRKAYPPPPNGIPHPFTKLMRYTLHYGDGLLRFTNDVSHPKRLPHGCVIVENHSGRWRINPGPWQAPRKLDAGDDE